MSAEPGMRAGMMPTPVDVEAPALPPHLQGLGEPLLSPYLLDMIGTAVDRRVTVGFNSNATLLNRRRAAELVDSGVDWLHVQNLFHSFSDTDPAGQYADIRAFTAGQALWTGADLDRATEVFARAVAAATETGLRLRLPGLTTTAPAPLDGRGCTWPWDAVYVTSTGAVQPCCMVMGDDRATLGQLSEQTFPQIWYGDAYREFRRGLMSDDPPEVCRGCSLYRGTF